MKYFIDTEFIETTNNIDLISIGIVSQDDRELHLGNRDCDFTRACPWVRENILRRHFSNDFTPNLNYLKDECNHGFWKTKQEIREEIISYFGGEIVTKTITSGTLLGSFTEIKFPDPNIEFWGWYSATDFVVFYQLFGRLVDLPRGFPCRCNDLKQEFDRLDTLDPDGLPGLDLPKKAAHNAIEDVRWIKNSYQCLKSKGVENV